MLETHFQNILESIGENPLRAGLLDTPKRAASALQFLTQGYQQSLDEIVNGALFPTHAKDMVLVKNIEFYSLCEHHLLPFTGKCHVAYLPNHAVLGISKIARIVDMYARRLQVQENLTQDIATAISQVTQSPGVGVIIEAQHFCMMMRGVEKQHATMITHATLGHFRDNPTLRTEWLNSIARTEKMREPASSLLSNVK